MGTSVNYATATSGILNTVNLIFFPFIVFISEIKTGIVDIFRGRIRLRLGLGQGRDRR